MAPNIHTSTISLNRRTRRLIAKLSPSRDILPTFSTVYSFPSRSTLTRRSRSHTPSSSTAGDSTACTTTTTGPTNNHSHNCNRRLHPHHNNNSNSSNRDLNNRKSRNEQKKTTTTINSCFLIFLILCIVLYLTIASVSIYNLSNTNDPCFVAKASLKNLVQISNMERITFINLENDYLLQHTYLPPSSLEHDVDVRKLTSTDASTDNSNESDNQSNSLLRPRGRLLQEQQGPMNLGLANKKLSSRDDTDANNSKSTNHVVNDHTTTLIPHADQMQQFTPEIPKIIHQQWKDESIPSKFMKWRTKWLTLFPQPEYQHMLWTDESARQLIVDHYPWFLQTYDNYSHNINRADAARYFILFHHGGIYADLDYEPLINFYNYLPQNRVGLIESPYYWNEKTQNSLMSSPKGDPFWADLFSVLLKNSQLDDVLVTTGPALVDDAISFSSHPTYILPCENFHRVPLGEYLDSSLMTVVGREMQFRLKPISKQCGAYRDDRCHFGKHHNTVSYRSFLGRLI